MKVLQPGPLFPAVNRENTPLTVAVGAPIQFLRGRSSSSCPASKFLGDGISVLAARELARSRSPS